MKRGLFAVLIAPTSPDDEPQLNRWYEEVHFGEILRTDGVVSAALYRAADSGLPPALSATPYLALYEVEGQSVGEARKSLEEALPTFQPSQLIESDPEPLRLWFEEVLPRQTRDS